MMKNLKIMIGIKKLFWTFPIIISIIIIISILTPTAYYQTSGVKANWWIWDYVYIASSGYETVNEFISGLDFIIPSLISTILLTFSIILNLFLANKLRRHKFKVDNFQIISIINIILLSTTPVYYMLALEIALYDGVLLGDYIFPEGTHFWTQFNLGFGIIGLFLNAGLIFLILIIYRYITSRPDIS